MTTGYRKSNKPQHRSTQIKLARKLTRLVKPCHFYKAVETPKGDKLICGYDQSRRNRCKTVNCPHFTPTIRYRIARYFGMVR